MPARPITLTALVGLLLTAAACDQPPQAPPPKPPKPLPEPLGELPTTDVIRTLPHTLRDELFILLVDHDGQAGADLQAVDGNVSGQQDAHAASKDNVVRTDGAQLPDDHGVRHLRRD